MTTIVSVTDSRRNRHVAWVASSTAAILVFAMATVASAQQSFKTAEEAAHGRWRPRPGQGTRRGS
jgi:hypothetical protein